MSPERSVTYVPDRTDSIAPVLRQQTLDDFFRLLRTVNSQPERPRRWFKNEFKLEESAAITFLRNEVRQVSKTRGWSADLTTFSSMLMLHELLHPRAASFRRRQYSRTEVSGDFTSDRLPTEFIVGAAQHASPHPGETAFGSWSGPAHARTRARAENPSTNRPDRAIHIRVLRHMRSPHAHHALCV